MELGLKLVELETLGNCLKERSWAAATGIEEEHPKAASILLAFAAGTGSIAVIVTDLRMGSLLGCFRIRDRPRGTCY